MDKILLSELIERTHDSIRSLEHSQSTIYQYRMAWKALADYFLEHDQALFSKPLAEQYILESKTKQEAGVIQRWRHKLNRLTVQMLIECFEEVRSHGSAIRNSQYIYTQRLTYSWMRTI